MDKICTTIEQSKKLIELGININTADMCWSIDIPDLPTLLAYPITDCDNWENKIPAWSLSALMEILQMPTLMKDKADGELFWECIVCNEEGEELCETYANDKVDACYEMIIELNELNLL